MIIKKTWVFIPYLPLIYNLIPLIWINSLISLGQFLNQYNKEGRLKWRGQNGRWKVLKVLLLLEFYDFLCVHHSINSRTAWIYFKSWKYPLWLYHITQSKAVKNIWLMSKYQNSWMNGKVRSWYHFQGSETSWGPMFCIIVPSDSQRKLIT